MILPAEIATKIRVNALAAPVMMTRVPALPLLMIVPAVLTTATNAANPN
jgi:hypothetical protein